MIIGAGPTGLGAAYRLRELGYINFHMYERSDHLGGLAASFTDSAGFTWDNHLLLGEAEQTIGIKYESTLESRNAARHERALAKT